jgi:DNA invertase Pin-like site-specific DNA recombinase
VARLSIQQVRRDLRDRPITKVVGYVRVSPSEQADGQSPDSQEAEVRKHAQRQGWRLAKVFRDVPHEGNTMERPGIDAMAEYCRREHCDIVAKNVKRWARCPGEAIVWLKQRHFEGVRFRSVQERGIDETPSGQKLLNDALAEAEKDNADRAENIAVGMAYADEQGKWGRKCWFG